MSVVGSIKIGPELGDGEVEGRVVVEVEVGEAEGVGVGTKSGSKPIALYSFVTSFTETFNCA